MKVSWRTSCVAALAILRNLGMKMMPTAPMDVTSPGPRTATNVRASMSPGTLDAGKLSDIRVRQAISLAIDRVGIADALLNGADPEIQPYPSTHWAYVPGLEPPRWSPITAQKMVKDAGADGMTLSIGYTAGTPFELVAQAVQSQLKDIGINVVMVPKATNTAAVVSFNNNEFDAFEGAITASSDPSVLLSDIWTANFKLIRDPASLKKANDIATSALDPQMNDEERGKAYRGLWQQLTNELWAVPIVRTYQTYASTTKSNIKGIEDMGWTWSGVFDMRSLWVPKA